MHVQLCEPFLSTKLLFADPEYQAFVERLNAEPAALPSAAAAPPLAVPASAKSGGEVVVTPLMAYLREKHAQRGRPSKAEAPNNHDKVLQSPFNPNPGAMLLCCLFMLILGLHRSAAAARPRR
jgi:hypothetical protein